MCAIAFIRECGKFCGWCQLDNYDGKVHFNIIVTSLNLAKLRIKKKHYKLSDAEKCYYKMGFHP